MYLCLDGQHRCDVISTVADGDDIVVRWRLSGRVNLPFKPPIKPYVVTTTFERDAGAHELTYVTIYSIFKPLGIPGSMGSIAYRVRFLRWSAHFFRKTHSPRRRRAALGSCSGRPYGGPGPRVRLKGWIRPCFRKYRSMKQEEILISRNISMSIGYALIDNEHVTEKEGPNDVTLAVGAGGNQTSCIGSFFCFP